MVAMGVSTISAVATVVSGVVAKEVSKSNPIDEMQSRVTGTSMDDGLHSSESSL